MISTLAWLQWIILLAVLTFAFRHSYRAGRITVFSVVFTWAALTLEVLAFAAYAHSLSRGHREQWANHFPDGQHVLGMLLIAGWMNGLLVSIVAAGVRRLIRGDRLLQTPGGTGENERSAP